MDLFKFITNEDIDNCVDIWKRGVKTFGAPVSIRIDVTEIKEVLTESPRYCEMLAEAIAGVQQQDFSYNETLIDEVFTYLDGLLEDDTSSNLLH